MHQILSIITSFGLYTAAMSIYNKRHHRIDIQRIQLRPRIFLYRSFSDDVLQNKQQSTTIAEINKGLIESVIKDCSGQMLRSSKSHFWISESESKRVLFAGVELDQDSLNSQQSSITLENLANYKLAFIPEIQWLVYTQEPDNYEDVDKIIRPAIASLMRQKGPLKVMQQKDEKGNHKIFCSADSQLDRYFQL